MNTKQIEVFETFLDAHGQLENFKKEANTVPPNLKDVYKIEGNVDEIILGAFSWGGKVIPLPKMNTLHRLWVWYCKNNGVQQMK